MKLSENPDIEPKDIFTDFNVGVQKIITHNGGNKARLAYPNLSSYRRTLQPNGLYCVLSAAFY